MAAIPLKRAVWAAVIGVACVCAVMFVSSDGGHATTHLELPPPPTSPVLPSDYGKSPPTITKTSQVPPPPTGLGPRFSAKTERFRRLQAKQAQAHTKAAHTRELAAKARRNESIVKRNANERREKSGLTNAHNKKLTARIAQRKAKALRRAKETNHKRIASESRVKHKRNTPQHDRMHSSPAAQQAWRRAKERTIKAGSSKAVTSAKAAMAKTIAAAANRAASKARLAVAKHGGNIRQQLKAAAAAADVASRTAAKLARRQVQVTASRSTQAARQKGKKGRTT